MKSLVLAISAFLAIIIYHNKISALKNENIQSSSKIRFENLEKGTAYISIYDSSNGFPDSSNKAIKTLKVKVPANKQVKLKNMPKKIAVSAFIDTNNNEKLDKNMVGAPTEPYAFSNSDPANLLPPKFEDALVSSNDEIVLHF